MLIHVYITALLTPTNIFLKISPEIPRIFNVQLLTPQSKSHDSYKSRRLVKTYTCKTRHTQLLSDESNQKIAN